MGNRKPNASTGTEIILRELDRLVEELFLACKILDSEDRSGLVNLNRALNRASRLRTRIRTKHQEPFRLKRILDAIIYIISVAKLIYSLFNCIQTHMEGYDDPWDYYKVVTNSWGLPPRFLGQPAWHIQGLSFAT